MGLNEWFRSLPFEADTPLRWTTLLIALSFDRLRFFQHKKSPVPVTETGPWKPGAGNETRTRDPNLGKVVLYQLSYSRGGWTL